jgi:hypothetical protein
VQPVFESVEEAAVRGRGADRQVADAGHLPGPRLGAKEECREETEDEGDKNAGLERENVPHTPPSEGFI